MKKTIGFLTLMFLICLTIFPNPSAASGYGWGFKKSTNHEIPDIGKYKQMLDKYGAYYVDDSGDKVVYLTFDNGYEQGYTGKILDTLKKENVPATFFVTGHYVESKPELIKRMVSEGHIIGNHSYHHPDLTIVSKQKMKKELETLEDAVAEITDQEQMKYLRPPRGIFSEQTLKWANELGYIHIFWSLAFSDWNTDKQKGGDYAYEQVMKQIHPGAIILLHTVSSDNAEALPRIITDLKKKGYTFKSLDDLIIKDMLPKFVY
ncbi:delta-lactam-biosynthetic de-N-acetylase [Virgibacillus phasianinus]|uniref:Delta-lactam-biosynthetic de-N-acetylase n=1 Tax=Virgibacillus phasianinus TaxID=2017483 RepID=A0A220TZ31_9BACI|nr:delta-lactam-biosynthetic de-N-acetylase [Virgibacillus phasianinus]ASK61067.1 delta-lactam-biosynthetic de-N-acetylase [Virgibacillus phasianinus]